MFFFIGVTLFSCFAAAKARRHGGCGRVQVNPEKIIGGNVASNGHWPWLVHLHDSKTACTGSIIANQFVITAGHCVQKAVAEHRKDFNITAGSVDYSEGVHFGVSQIFLHPNFSIERHTGPDGRKITDTFRDDVAILKLAKPVKYGPLVQPICLPSAFEETPGELAAVAGWGLHDERNPDGTLNLTCTRVHCPDSHLARENMVPLRSFKNCNDTTYGPNDKANDGIYPFTNPERFICAGGRDQGVYHGDSGGPLMINRKGAWYLIGTTDTGVEKPSHEDRFPDWYARVSSYCSWIKKVTGGKAKCRKIA
ncbi:polyserase-2-like protein [Aphelenchoides avenae]|nr:polyserase-2-like protein [Aphelenchus avenae]